MCDCGPTTLVSAGAGTSSEAVTTPVTELQLAFKSSITSRFTATPVVVVDGTEKELVRLTSLQLPAHIRATYGKFASEETVGTGLALVLVTCTSAAATPRVAFGASAAIRSTAKK